MPGESLHRATPKHDTQEGEQNDAIEINHVGHNLTWLQTISIPEIHSPDADATQQASALDCSSRRGRHTHHTISCAVRCAL